MSIRSWVADHPKGQRNRAIAKIANACGVTPAAVRHWIAGLRQIDPKYCPAIEQVTGIDRTEILWGAKDKAA